MNLPPDLKDHPCEDCDAHVRIVDCMYSMAEEMTVMTGLLKEIVDEKRAGTSMRNFWGPIIVGLITMAGVIASKYVGG